MVATWKPPAHLQELDRLRAELAETKQTLATVTLFLDQVQNFSEVVSKARAELKDLTNRRSILKDELSELNEEIRSCQNLIDSSNDAMLSVIEPGPAKFLPLFDRMEPADVVAHGEGAEQWREKPVSVLRLSPMASTALIEAGVVFVGQLQDLILAGPADSWWKSTPGLTDAMAAAIADKLNAFAMKGGRRE